MFENPRRGRQARNFTTNVPKILDLKSSSEQIFSRKLSLGAPDNLRTKWDWIMAGKVTEYSTRQTLNFLEPGRVSRKSLNFSGPGSWFIFAVIAFKIKVSIILEMRQWNYHLTKLNWLVCELGTACAATIQLVMILKFAFGPKKLPGLSRNGPLSRGTSDV